MELDIFYEAGRPIGIKLYKPNASWIVEFGICLVMHKMNIFLTQNISQLYWCLAMTDRSNYSHA